MRQRRDAALSPNYFGQTCFTCNDGIRVGLKCQSHHGKVLTSSTSLYSRSTFDLVTSPSDIALPAARRLVQYNSYTKRTDVSTVYRRRQQTHALASAAFTAFTVPTRAGKIRGFLKCFSFLGFLGFRVVFSRFLYEDRTRKYDPKSARKSSRTRRTPCEN